MDPVPLIPKSNQLENHDVSHVIREVFQEVVGSPEFSRNVADNTEKYNLENQNLKANGTRVITTYNGTKLHMEDIGFVEDNLMIRQGIFMKDKDVIDRHEMLTECVKLKRKEVFMDLDVKEVKNYGLLQKIDLLPNRPERSMDFRMNSNRHLCPLPCPNELDIYPTKLEKNDRKRKRTSAGKKSDERVVLFKAEPQSIIFEDYQTDVTYEQKFKLRNVSKTTQSFIPRILPKTSFFKVELQTGSTRVAPGMCVVFSVEYRTDVYQDVEEVMTFNTYFGRDVEVKLISTRKPPILIAFVFKNLEHFTQKFIPIEGFDLSNNGRRVALNSTIDCGSCLLGNKINLNLILKNEGNIGRFFIQTEDDWYFADITACNMEMELITGAFHIYPTYFEINTNDFAELDVTFFPIEYGLEVEKLFLLCNNNTLEELEIIGDGVLFWCNSVTVEGNLKPENMLDMDATSNYFIDCGKCIPYQSRTSSITVHNNSVVDLNYKWEVRESLCHIKGTELKKMNPSWITINETSTFLPGQCTTDFEVMLECKTKEPGLYSLVYTLYILDVPEASLAEDKSFYVIDEPQHESQTITDEFKPKLLTIIIDELEIFCEIVRVNIKFDPENITIPYVMKYQEVFNQKVQIHTCGPTALVCEWKPPNTDCIEIYPDKFVLEPEIVFMCNISIYTDTCEDIQEQLFLVVNNGLLEKTFNVTAKVIKPTARFMESVINFGYIPKGKKIEGKEIQVENIGQEMVYWEIFELYFDHECNTICELDASKHLSITRGELDRNKSCKLTYNIDNNDQHHRWLSFLILLSSHPTLEAMDSLCLITYEVTQPEIIIHTRSSQQPILYPGKLLYIGCTTFYMVCLHNIGTKLPGSFIWGKPVGKHANNINIKCSPKSGIVQPQKCVHITITLMPLETGILDEVYVPCFVGNMDEPIMLTVLCVVDNICLYFHLPNNEGKFEKIFWPPRIISDFEGFSLDLNYFGTEQEENSVDSLAEKLKKSLSTFRSSVEQGTSFSKDKSTDIKDEEVIPEDIFLPEEGNEDIYELHITLESSEGSVNEVLQESESTTSTSPTNSLKNCFGADLILQEHSLEYHMVPLRTPVKKTIIIENLTPLSGNFAVEATNFYALEPNDKKRTVTDDILFKLNIKKRDEWEESISAAYGIVVKPVPIKGILGPENSVEVDIWVYANTWGTYLEEILIEVNEIMPFCFSLLIQVIGVPIEFPIALNSTSNVPTIRFGNIPYISQPFQRKLKVTNFSCVPLCLVWHVFIPKNITTNKKHSEKEPFNVVVDTFQEHTNNFDLDDDTTLKLMITRHYYGKEDCTIFQIEPQEININPKSTETINVTINSSGFKAKFTKTQIRAYLIGHVHLAEEFKFQSNIYSRQEGVDISATKVKLLATLELPLLKLELVKGDTRIKAYANDIIEAQMIRYERVLVFRNVDTAPATVYMHCIAPFRVVSLRTAQTCTDKNVTAAVVQPGDCVEVLLECIVDADEVLQYSDMLFNENTSEFPEIPDFNNSSIALLRYLNIHQHGLRKQITSLEFVIFYPQLLLSHKVIDFGVVFVGNTKKMLLTLTNPTGSHVPFSIHKMTTSNSIIITPTTGVIPKAIGTTPTRIILCLYFIPGESKVYQEIIRILTNIPFYNFGVELTGTGTNNEKFYVEGT